MTDQKTEHTKTPYSIGPERENDTSARLFAGSRYIGAIWNSDESPEQSKANAAFIVQACNNHDNLVKALQTIADLSNATVRNVDDYGTIARKALKDAGVEVGT